MFSALRRTRLATSLGQLGLAAMLAVTVSSPLHDGGDDVLCNPVGSSDLRHTDRIVPAAHADGHAQHCLFCHAAQTVRVEQQSSRFGPPTLDGRLLVLGAPTFVHALVSPATPARAPPAV